MAKLNLRWHNVSPDPCDEAPRRKGLETAVVKAWSGGHHVGDLRVTFFDPVLHAERCPTPLHHMCATNGWCFDPDERDIATLWASAHRSASRTPAGIDERPWNLTRKHAPAPAVAAAQLAELADSFADTVTRYAAMHATPAVAYVKVPENRRRQGIATAMYVAAAHHLASDDRIAPERRVLRASELRTDAATAVWARFEETRPVPLIDVDLVDPYGSTRTYRALDARGVAHPAAAAGALVAAPS